MQKLVLINHSTCVKLLYIENVIFSKSSSNISITHLIQGKIKKSNYKKRICKSILINEVSMNAENLHQHTTFKLTSNCLMKMVTFSISLTTCSHSLRSSSFP